MNRLQAEEVRDWAMKQINERVVIEANEESASYDAVVMLGLLDSLHRAACRHLDSLPFKGTWVNDDAHPLELAMAHLAQAAMDDHVNRVNLLSLVEAVKDYLPKGGPS